MRSHFFQQMTNTGSFIYFFDFQSRVNFNGSINQRLFNQFSSSFLETQIWFCLEKQVSQVPDKTPFSKARAIKETKMGFYYERWLQFQHTSYFHHYTALLNCSCFSSLLSVHNKKNSSHILLSSLPPPPNCFCFLYIFVGFLPSALRQSLPSSMTPRPSAARARTNPALCCCFCQRLPSSDATQHQNEMHVHNQTY